MSPLLKLAVFAIALVAPVLECNAATIWREGEKPDSQTMNRHPWWYDKVKTDELSGGDWISNFSNEKEGTAKYTIEAPQAGEYAFWVRANPVGTKLSYTLDSGKETEIDFAGALDSRNIAEDGKLDIRFIAWASAGKLKLTQGKHTLVFRMHSDNSNHGGLDCFVLTTESFTPSGTKKPGEKDAAVIVTGTKETWPFNPGEDKFSADALLDLRSMNEKTAGEKGFIKLSADGMSFVRSDGQPIRFWGANAGGQHSQENIDEQMRFLAKRGVNMVRLHMNVTNPKEGAKVTDVNEAEIDTIFRYVAAAKKNGIYLTISPYWASVQAPRSWQIDDYANTSLWGILFFNDHLQEGYKAWTREVYTRKNPYTGIALKDEPAVAIIQVQNEDSLLFWTFQGIKPAQRKILGKKFGDWLVKKYGSLEKSAALWGNEKVKEDDFASGIVGLYQTYNMTLDLKGNAAKRMRDQTEFMAWIQHKFYADMEAHYRSLGCKQLVNAMNWRSADPVRLDDIERWTYTANEVLAVNNYFNGAHVGANNGYRIDPGHFLTNNSALRHPEQLLANLKQVVGHPMLITEAAWTHPNLYQTEGPFLMAAYQSLTGIDCAYWFAMGDKSWLLDPRRKFWPVGDSYAVDKWSGNVPQVVGMFPAFAIAFRDGLVKQAEKPVVYEERSLEDLWERKIPIISESGKFDPNRDAGSFAAESKIKQEVDRLAFLVGPVEVKFGGNPANSRVVDLSKYIDRANGTVKSITGQIEMDSKRGVCTVNAPKFAGVCGFLKEAGGDFDLGIANVKSQDDYATIGIVPMDDQPLATSKKVLIQAGTTAKLTGWTTKKAQFKAEGNNGPSIEGEQIVNTGAPPWQIGNTKATITLKNSGLTKATLLDPNGYATKEIPVKTAGGSIVIELPSDSMYVVLR